MAVRLVIGVRGHSDLGRLEHLVEGESRRCGNLVLLERSLGCLTIWPESSHCGCPLAPGVVIHGGEAVGVSAGGIRVEAIVVEVVSERDEVGNVLDGLAELPERPDVSLHIWANEVAILLAFYLDAPGERIHGMTRVKGLEICWQNGGVKNGNALLELVDNCHPLAGVEGQTRAMECDHVSRTGHAAVRQVFHDKANVAVDYRRVHPASLAEGNEL